MKLIVIALIATLVCAGGTFNFRQSAQDFIYCKVTFKLFIGLVLSSNDAIGSGTFYLLYSVYYFYCFNIASLAFSQSDDLTGVRAACMNGIYKELTNVFELSYGTPNTFATKSLVVN